MQHLFRALHNASRKMIFFIFSDCGVRDPMRRDGLCTYNHELRREGWGGGQLHTYLGVAMYLPRTEWY